LQGGKGEESREKGGVQIGKEPHFSKTDHKEIHKDLQEKGGPRSRKTPSERRFTEGGERLHFRKTLKKKGRRGILLKNQREDRGKRGEPTVGGKGTFELNRGREA